MLITFIKNLLVISLPLRLQVFTHFELLTNNF